jgi:hypothetical protein
MFDFAHRIVVGYDGTDGLLFGRLILFSKFSLALHFGYALQGEPSKASLIYINPLADQRKESMRTRSLQGAIGRPKRPLGRSRPDIRQGREALVQSAVDSLIAEMLHRRLQKDARRAVRLLLVAAKAGPQEAMRVVEQICSDSHQRILNLARSLPQATVEARRSERLRELTRSIQHAPMEPTGLTVQGHKALHAMTAALAAHMFSELKEGTLDGDQMESLLGGSAGQSVLEKSLEEFSRK